MSQLLTTLSKNFNNSGRSKNFFDIEKPENGLDSSQLGAELLRCLRLFSSYVQYSRESSKGAYVLHLKESCSSLLNPLSIFS